MGQSKRYLGRQAEIEQILQELPEETYEYLDQWIYTDENVSTVADAWLLVERYADVEETVPIGEIMEPEDWDAYEKGKRAFWGARCKCTFCGEVFRGRWVRDRKRRVSMIELELSYHPEEWELADRNGVYRAEIGDNVSCPYCEQWARVAPKSALRRGRTYQKVAGAWWISATGSGYAGIIYWLERYQIDAEGDAGMEVLPREALIVSKTGELLRFTHRSYSGYGENDIGGWEYRKLTGKTVGDIPYHSADMRGRGKNCSVVHWNETYIANEIKGTTLEKTAAWKISERYDAFADEGIMTERYLRLWKRHPNVENLVHSGWGLMVSGLLERPEYEALIDWNEVRPHRMLGIHKEDLPIGRDKCWTVETLLDYQSYCRSVEELTAREFDRFRWNYGNMFGNLISCAAADPDYWRLQKVERYLTAQGVNNGTGLGWLIDYRRTAEALHALHTERDWWPKNLREQHDRIAAAFVAKKNGVGKEAFTKLKEELAGLIWSDGEYAILLPDSQEALSEEGAVLQHCVGTYASAHCKGSDVIFFVRKARRPERSWLTLDIRFTEGIPYEVQLHGYCNEYLESGKRIRIPERGRRFVDQWKEQVLKPWYLDRVREAIQEGEKTA